MRCGRTAPAVTLAARPAFAHAAIAPPSAVSELGVVGVSYRPVKRYMPKSVLPACHFDLRYYVPTAMSHLSLKRIAIAFSAVVLLMTRGAYGDHLPPVTPVLPGQDHRHENHSGADFSFDDLSDVNFSEGNFTQTLFEDARLDRVLFIGATLDRALLRTQFTDGANFTGASLVNAELRGMGGTEVVFADADLSGVEMDDSFFHFSDFRNVNFAGADLGEFTAEDSDFRGADLSSAVNMDSLFFRSVYDSSTHFPSGYDPQGAGMIFVPEPTTATLLLLGFMFAGGFRWQPLGTSTPMRSRGSLREDH
jgi:hypothetical protein